ncbi:MAG TPA: ECF-type sigma factor [Verrucomicrobiae bacterium]|nr:ECF-type sigma factor [Verrucomicrobiae bacterium]
MNDREDPEKKQTNAAFTTTHWSVVLSAGEAESSAGQRALAWLCETYWYPLYVYVRRQGYGPDDAQDLTQEFFCRLLEKNYLRSIDRQKGKFRSFLLAAMEHFLAKHWRDSHRLKRGGGHLILSLDERGAEECYQMEPFAGLTAEHLYERRWALTLIEQALRRLRQEFAAADRSALLEALQPFLSADRADLTYAQVGSRLDMSEGAVKVAVHRLRARYGELVREEIGKTVASPEEVDQELRYLIEVIGRGGREI